MPKSKKPYKTLRNFIISMIILVLLACLLPFFLKGPDERALVSPEAIELPALELLEKRTRDSRRMPALKGGKTERSSQTIYKWKDPNGVTHFSDYPNPDGPSQAIPVLPERTARPDISASRKQPSRAESDPEAPTTRPTIRSPSQVKKLKQDAEKIKETLQQRYDEMSPVP